MVSFVVGVSVSVRSQDLGLPVRSSIYDPPALRLYPHPPLERRTHYAYSLYLFRGRRFFLCFAAAGACFVSFPHVLSLLVSLMRGIPLFVLLPQVFLFCALTPQGLSLFYAAPQVFRCRRCFLCTSAATAIFIRFFAACDLLASVVAAKR